MKMDKTFFAMSNKTSSMKPYVSLKDVEYLQFESTHSGIPAEASMCQNVKGVKIIGSIDDFGSLFVTFPKLKELTLARSSHIEMTSINHEDAKRLKQLSYFNAYNEIVFDKSKKALHISRT